MHRFEFVPICATSPFHSLDFFCHFIPLSKRKNNKTGVVHDPRSQPTVRLAVKFCFVSLDVEKSERRTDNAYRNSDHYQLLILGRSCGSMERGVTNDPLGQHVVSTGSDVRLFWKVETDGRTTYVKIMITTGLDCGFGYVDQLVPSWKALTIREKVNIAEQHSTLFCDVYTLLLYNGFTMASLIGCWTCKNDRNTIRNLSDCCYC